MKSILVGARRQNGGSAATAPTRVEWITGINDESLKALICNSLNRIYAADDVVLLYDDPVAGSLIPPSDNQLADGATYYLDTSLLVPLGKFCCYIPHVLFILNTPTVVFNWCTRCFDTERTAGALRGKTIRGRGGQHYMLSYLM